MDYSFSCPSKVAQLLLSIFAIYKTRESVPNFCSQFLGLKAQIMKNVPVGISESFARLRFSFPVAGFFGGRLRPDKGAQVPENSLARTISPAQAPDSHFLWLDFLVAGCGQMRGHKPLRPIFRLETPHFRFLCLDIFCCGQIVGRKSFKNP